MKRLLLLCLPLLLIVACQSQDSPGQTTEKESPVKEETPVQNEAEKKEDSPDSDANEDEDESIEDEIASKIESLDFYEFELEVEYLDDKEYEAKVEQEGNRPFEAKVEDEINDIYLRGEQAFEDIFPKLQELDLHYSSEEADVVDQVLDAFNLADNFIKFEIEVKFHDGGELDFEVKR